MPSYEVRAGAQAPERLTLRVEDAVGDSEPLDLSTVSAVRLEVRKPDGVTVVWPVDILQQEADHILVEHEYLVTDVWVPGTYQLRVFLTVPDGVRRAGPGMLQVLP
jgi:hypothetical protein